MPTRTRTLKGMAVALFGFVCAIVAFNTAPTVAAEIRTITDYDNATQEQRNSFVADTLKRIDTLYRSKPGTQNKAACMLDLYQTKNASGDPKLFTLIVNEIDAARSDDPDKYVVEDIIFGVIEHECSAEIRTIRDYDNATEEERNSFVADTLKRIDTFYRSKPETESKASCMVDLYETKNASGTPRLFTLIVNEIDAARSDDPDSYIVEDVIFGVIEDACKAA